MVKVIKIQNCSYCKYKMFTTQNYCTNEKVQKNGTLKPLKDYPNIPDWCPLEDDIGNLTMDYRELSDADARIEIKYSLNKMKREGYKNFNVIDVMIETELPPNQINRILKELKDEVNP